VAGSHLGYCTNIHPGETWNEVQQNLRRHLPEVKRRVSPDGPLGLGLRLSAVAAEALEEPGALQEFEGFLREQDLYVFTINGFPYGSFHGTRVKEAVYLPDWRDEARLDYTNRLARLLARWIPEGPGDYGSISTVPGAFKANATTDAARTAIADRLIRHAAELAEIERRTGRHLVLALEPEPCCMLETIEETVDFFRSHLHSDAATQRFAQLARCSARDAESALSRHLGVCLDLCHAAVEFEDPRDCVRQLRGAGIAIAKVQVTAGLRLPRVDAAAVGSLREFADEVYLHQVVERGEAGLERYADIDAAIGAGRWLDGDREWRVHFHVPVFVEALEQFGSTQEFVRESLGLHAEQVLSRHLEVETYTWTVLPSQYRSLPIDEAISRELLWVRDVLQ
jgi:sugar phosphate isomerase/epimerase